MSNVLTSDDLLTSVKRRASIPSDQSTFTDEDILEILNEEMDIFGVPHLLQVHEEYLVYYEDQPLVADVFEYRIPYRAVGNKLRDVALVDADDNINELSRVGLDEISDFKNSGIDVGNDLFYVMNDKVVLLSDQYGDSANIRMYFYLRPNSLAEADEIGTVSTIDTSTGIVTLTAFPSDFTNLPDMDFIQHKSPNKIYSYDITPTAVNRTAKTITFDASDLPTDLEVGDYIAPRTKTNVPQLPTELHPILAQRAAVAILEALGDSEGYNVASSRLEKMEDSIWKVLDNRVEGAPQKIVSRYNTLREAQGNTYSNRGRRGRF